MKKEIIETTKLEDYIEAMNKKDGLRCELEDGTQCTIDRIILTNGTCSAVQARIDVLNTKGTRIGGLLPTRVKIYRYTFENGDYVHTDDGSIFIYAGKTKIDVLFHAGTNSRGMLIVRDYTDPDYNNLWDSVAHCDRLCTDEEKTILDQALMKEGKIFDPAQKKVVDSENATHSKGWLIEKHIVTQRGKFTQWKDIQECIDIYEARMQELTEMYNEIYKKLKEAQKS